MSARQCEYSVDRQDIEQTACSFMTIIFFRSSLECTDKQEQHLQICWSHNLKSKSKELLCLLTIVDRESLGQNDTEEVLMANQMISMNPMMTRSP